MNPPLKPILSIVIPTREGLSEHWLQALLQIKGNIELILVHPPGMAKFLISDSRLQQINASFRGEIIQRMTGLLNATGQYILTINCDEYLNPDIVEITINYFKNFPDSWVMRLNKQSFDFGDKASLEKPWETITPIEKLKICNKSQNKDYSYEQGNCLHEIPIAPLDNQFDLRCFFKNRKDHHGAHTENFDKKVWKNEMLQETLPEIIKLMVLPGPLKYVPFWCLDRLLGLFIQAKFFEKGKIIGHLLPPPEQIRVEDNPPEYKRTRRFYLMAEILLLRRFPQYGYLWNLIVDQIRGTIFRGFRFLLRLS
jgi:hypothetical protein